VRILATVCVSLVLGFGALATGCSTVSSTDLRAMQSKNAVVKRDAIRSVSTKERGFVYRLFAGFMGKTNEKRAVEILQSLLRSGKEPVTVELCIIKALGEFGKRVEVRDSLLLERLKGGSPEVRRVTIEALGKMRSKRASTVLMALVNQKEYRYPAIWALGEIGDQEAVPTLNALLASNNQYVRYHARKALAKLGVGAFEEMAESQNPVLGNTMGGIIDVGSMVFSGYQSTMKTLFSLIAGSS